MPLPSFTVTGDLFNIVGDVAGSELTAPHLTGSITFTPNVSSNELVKWEGDLYRVAPVTGRISGSGVTRNGLPLELLANDAGLSITGLQWHVEISVKPDPGTGITRAMKDFWFDAPNDGATIDLAAVTPAVSAAVQGVAFTEGQLVALLSNGTSNVRETLDTLYAGGRTEYYVNLAAFPATGNTTKEYVAQDTGKIYRWNGSAYVELSVGEPVISAGTTGQYWRGDKSWQALDKSAVGLSAADNTSDTAKPVSTAQQAALDLKAPLASPTFTGTVSGVSKAMVGLGSVDNTADSAKPVSTAQQAALDSKQPVLTATAVKTSAYTAAVGDLIPGDASSGAVTVTLPTTPADKARVVVKKIDNSANAVTIAAGGSDVFNKAGGSTALALTLQNQAVQLQYKASGGVWYVISTDVPLAGTDARYLNFIQAAKNPDLLVTGAVTLDGNGLVTSAVVAWPDGSPGTLTVTSRDANSNVLAYNITYGSPVTKTYTQPTITRNTNGAATNVPQIVVT